MPKYNFWYAETHTFVGAFDADNIEEAERLLKAVGKDVADLPNFESKQKDSDREYDLESLEEETSTWTEKKTILHWPFDDSYN
jgi:hypothetical protein